MGDGGRWRNSRSGILQRQRINGVGKMNRIKPAPPFDELNDLITFKKISQRAICKTYGISCKTLKKWMCKYNISQPPRHKCIPKKDQLLSLYTIDSMSIQNIADHYDVSYDTVRRWLDKYDIPVQPGKGGSGGGLKVKLRVPPDLAKTLKL